MKSTMEITIWNRTGIGNTDEILCIIKGKSNANALKMADTVVGLAFY